MEIMNVDAIFHRLKTELVGCPMNVTTFDATTS